MPNIYQEAYGTIRTYYLDLGSARFINLYQGRGEFYPPSPKNTQSLRYQIYAL